jgi:hypothetical protein
MATFPFPIVVAVPVKNEETQIGACLDSLCNQTRAFDRLILLLNNCADASWDICCRFKSRRYRGRQRWLMPVCWQAVCCFWSTIRNQKSNCI